MEPNSFGNLPPPLHLRPLSKWSTTSLLVWSYGDVEFSPAQPHPCHPVTPKWRRQRCIARSWQLHIRLGRVHSNKVHEMRYQVINLAIKCVLSCSLRQANSERLHGVTAAFNTARTISTIPQESKTFYDDGVAPQILWCDFSHAPTSKKTRAFH